MNYDVFIGSFRHILVCYCPFITYLLYFILTLRVGGRDCVHRGAQKERYFRIIRKRRNATSLQGKVLSFYLVLSMYVLQIDGFIMNRSNFSLCVRVCVTGGS